jgi:hypothetical protein
MLWYLRRNGFWEVVSRRGGNWEWERMEEGDGLGGLLGPASSLDGICVG